MNLHPDVLHTRHGQEVVVEPLLICGNRKGDEGTPCASHGNLYKQLFAESID